MATGVGPPLACRELQEEDLAFVFEALVPVADKYEVFGIQIGMKMNEIYQFRRMHFSDPQKCLLEILSTRLERSPALTWNDIDRALRSRSVGKTQLANSIQKQYDPSFKGLFGLKKSEKMAVKNAQGEHEAAKRGESMKDACPQHRTLVSEEEQKLYKKVHQTEIYKKPSKKLQADDNNERTKKAKANSSPSKERGDLGKKRKEIEIPSEPKAPEPSSDSTREDSEDEEYETEHDHESSPATSEEEVKEKPTFQIEKTAEGKEQRVKITAHVQDIPGDKGQSGPGGRGRDQGEHDIQPKKRSRRRHDSNMSQRGRVSSSPSTSQEGNKKQLQSKRGDTEAKKQRRKKKRKKNAENILSSSESDDSSPECDMTKNLSKEEGKVLRNIFKRYFGQLCCEIPDPVETAAQLQKKGVISQSMMKDMIMSPESQQAKKIVLLSTLDKRMKLHPECLFAFIEISLENATLRKTGFEILAEAGK